MKQELD